MLAVIMHIIIANILLSIYVEFTCKVCVSAWSILCDIVPCMYVIYRDKGVIIRPKKYSKSSHQVSNSETVCFKVNRKCSLGLFGDSCEGFIKHNSIMCNMHSLKSVWVHVLRQNYRSS